MFMKIFWKKRKTRCNLDEIQQVDIKLTYISGLLLHLSTGQCQTTCCTHYKIIVVAYKFETCPQYKMCEVFWDETATWEPLRCLQNLSLSITYLTYTKISLLIILFIIFIDLFGVHSLKENLNKCKFHF